MINREAFQLSFVQDRLNYFDIAAYYFLFGRLRQVMITMNTVIMWLDLLDWAYQNYSMLLVKKIWLLILFPIQWVYFFRYHFQPCPPFEISMPAYLFVIIVENKHHQRLSGGYK